MQKRITRILGPLLGITLLLIALVVLAHKLSMFSLQDIEQAMRKIPRERIVLAFLLTCCYYVLITAYDTLSFHVVRHPLPYRRIALAAFTGYAFSHNVGLTMVSSGSVRFRIHSSFGLTTKETAKVIAFSALSYWIGCLAIASMLFLLLPMRIPHVLHVPFHSVRILGMISLALLIVYSWYSLHSTCCPTIRTIKLPRLTPTVFSLQLLIGSLDWILSASIPFLLLPQAHLIGFPRFFEVFLLAQIAGLLSQIPGGIGVFEGMLFVLLPHGFSLSETIGILVVYRLIFYIVPLLIATILLAMHEVRIAKLQHPISTFRERHS